MQQPSMHNRLAAHALTYGCVSCGVCAPPQVDEAAVWSELAHAQLAAGKVADAITSYLKAGDSSQYLQVMQAAFTLCQPHVCVRVVCLFVGWC